MTRASIATWTAWRPSRSTGTPSSRAAAEMRSARARSPSVGGGPCAPRRTVTPSGRRSMSGWRSPPAASWPIASTSSTPLANDPVAKYVHASSRRRRHPCSWNRLGGIRSVMRSPRRHLCQLPLPEPLDPVQEQIERELELVLIVATRPHHRSLLVRDRREELGDGGVLLRHLGRHRGRCIRVGTRRVVEQLLGEP